MLDCVTKVQQLKTLLQDAEISMVETEQMNLFTSHITNLISIVQQNSTYFQPSLSTLVNIPEELRQTVLRNVSLFPKDKSKLKLLTNICQSCLNLVNKVIIRYQQPKNDKLLPMIMVYPDFIVLQLAIVERLLAEKETTEKTIEFIKSLTKFQGILMSCVDSQTFKKSLQV